MIDIDDDNDSTELVLVGDKVGKIDKGKAIATVHDDYGDHQNMVYDLLFLTNGCCYLFQHCERLKFCWKSFFRNC